jgi:hypothetical protein
MVSFRMLIDGDRFRVEFRKRTTKVSSRLMERLPYEIDIEFVKVPRQVTGRTAFSNWKATASNLP